MTKNLIALLALWAVLSPLAHAAGNSKTPAPRPSPRPVIVPKVDALGAQIGRTIDAALRPAASLEDAARFAGDGANLLQGRRPDLAYGAVAVPIFEGAFDDAFGYESFSLGFASRRGPAASAAAAVPAPAAEQPRTISGRFSYAWRRAGLGLIARTWGIEASLPLAGEELFARALEEAAGKRVVFMDFDRTVGPHADKPTPGNAAAFGAVKKRGKQNVVISDRPVLDDGKKNRSLQESFSDQPAEDMDGAIVAGKKDGVIVRYDANKTPVVIHTAEGFNAAQLKVINEQAAPAFKARLAALGVRQHDGSGGIPAESVSKYSFAIMLAPGTSEDKVLEAAEALEKELKDRGLNFEVEGRMAYEAGKPPYVTFSIIDKSWAVREVARILKISPSEAVIIGDSMYAPVVPKNLGVTGRWALRLALRLSGRPMPKTGNNTDEAMEWGLPGALTFGVGAYAGPKLKNGYAVPGTLAATQRILEAVASKPVAPARRFDEHPMVVLLAALALLAVGVLGWYMMITMFADVFSLGEAALRAGPEADFWDR